MELKKKEKSRVGVLTHRFLLRDILKTVGEYKIQIQFRFSAILLSLRATRICHAAGSFAGLKTKIPRVNFRFQI